jgi:hypothetical protein
MPVHQMNAGKLDEAEEIFDMGLPSREEPAEGVHLGKKPFDLPAVLVATELRPIWFYLGCSDTQRSSRCRSRFTAIMSALAPRRVALNWPDIEY